MQVTFKLAVDPAEKAEIAAAIHEILAAHAERLQYGKESHYPFNCNQNITFIENEGDVEVTIEGERCALVQDGLLTDFKKFVSEILGSEPASMLADATKDIGKSVFGITCLEYQTSDWRLAWDQTLRDWLALNPDSTETRGIYWSAVSEGHIYTDEFYPQGRVEGGNYSVTELAAINAVLATLDPDDWQNRAEAVKAFNDARQAMMDAF